MQTRTLLLMSAVLAVALPSAASAATGSDPDEPIVSRIVVLQPGVDPGALARSHARKLDLAVTQVYEHAFAGYAARVPAGRLDELAADPRVRLVAEDRPVEAVEQTSVYPLPPIKDQTVPTGVDRIDADVSSVRAGDRAGAVAEPIAILDTGIEGDHPDLNVAGGTSCIAGETFADDHGHGTYVAGIAAAKDNDFGVVGVAPGAPVYGVKVLAKTGRGSDSTVVCGLDWLVANAGRLGIRVANMSLGGIEDGQVGPACEDGSDVLAIAVCAAARAGLVITAAAGNNAADLGTHTPAAYDEVLAVTATWDNDGAPGGVGTETPSPAFPGCASRDDVAAFFSNFTTPAGADARHTIAAPGTCIVSTSLRGENALASGTSAAAPHVAGIAAVCLAVGRCRGDAGRVLETLLHDAVRQPAGYGFLGDPRNPLVVNGITRYYGYLAYAGAQ
jgi:subtilisin family serine protease